jgi:hypothetical protein
MNEPFDQLPAYEPPEILSYTDDDILEELGPAQTNYNVGTGPGPSNY